MGTMIVQTSKLVTKVLGLYDYEDRASATEDFKHQNVWATVAEWKHPLHTIESFGNFSWFIM